MKKSVYKKFKCGECNEGLITQVLTENATHVDVSIAKCSKCKFQYGIKGLIQLVEIKDEFLFTKGNWYLQTSADAYTNIIRCNNGQGFDTIYIASTQQNSDLETQANAQLMAAAPDLLKSLIEIIKISDRKHAAWEEAKKAIAKALTIQEKGIF